MIELYNVSKKYYRKGMEVIALHNINLVIEDGEYVAIIGDSGSGKSTLLNILGCLDIISEGTYYLDGEDISEMESDHLAETRNKHIGFIFQSFRLIDYLSAWENVQIPLIYANANKSKREKRAKQVLHEVELSERMYHLPGELSGGQQQRLAIARAISMPHDIILADEPTGNLDRSNCEEVMNILEKINSQGATLLIVTHDLQIATRADRVIEIYRGEIINDTRKQKQE